MIARDVVDASALQAWATEIASWPPGTHAWGHYAERTATGEATCRTENPSACHPGLAALVDGPLRDLASELLGAPAVAFKDKINYKQPGGAGFSPHQDLLAYPGVDRVMSLLVAIDACTEDSGCLWLAPPAAGLLETDGRGVVVESQPYVAVPMGPGDVACLDGLAAHYSEANRSDRQRRVLVASYAPATSGYSRQTYYAARATTMADATETDGLARISTLADFEGEPVPSTGGGACTHPEAVTT